MEKEAKIYIAGCEGLLGSALTEKVLEQGYVNVVTPRFKDLDLRNQANIEDFFDRERPEYVFLIAAKVGGILANIKYPAQFIYDNLLIQSNVINSAYKYGAKKLLFISSACTYPKLSPQPMKEEYILTQKPESTNEYYALAKICGMKLIEAYSKEYGISYCSIISPNMYGIKDNFNLETAHVIPALIRKMHSAKINNENTVNVYGSGNVRREFVYAGDIADACLFFIDKLSGGESINIGSGEDVSIKELAYLIKKIANYDGELVFDTSKPEGMPLRLLDVSNMLKFDWRPKVSLQDGLQKTLEWYAANYKEIK